MPNLLWITLALSGSPGTAANQFDSTRPFAVVELYTSEGCSSCPPAEAYLNHLAAGDGQVLALAFHVDYWDYLFFLVRANAELPFSNRSCCHF